ncbi:HNH endonuclease [Tsukamurella strandjordii]|nr:hypothetical protein TTY48_01070 [Tsukamurella sp. TY48]
MTGRAPKTCSWRNPENMAQGCSRPAVEHRGRNYRCEQHPVTENFDANQRARRRRIKPLTTAEKDHIRERDWHVCRECGAPANQVDHIVEIADGGDNRPSNLQLLCDEHHALKTAQSRRDGDPRDGATKRRELSARALQKRRLRERGFYVQ